MVLEALEREFFLLRGCCVADLRRHLLRPRI